MRLQGNEADAFGDAGHKGAKNGRRCSKAKCNVAMQPWKHRALDQDQTSSAIVDVIERHKSRAQAEGEHRFWIKAPIRTHQAAHSRCEEEHCCDDNGICTVKPVAGAQALAGDDRRRESMKGKMARKTVSWEKSRRYKRRNSPGTRCGHCHH